MLKLAEAEKRATQILTCIGSLVSRAAVAGSVRRRRPQPHDIDIVVIPKQLQVSVFNVDPDTNWDGIYNRLSSRLNMTKIRKGAKLMTLGFPDVDLPVDIYRATPETWGVLLLIRTGSIEYNIMLCSRAKRMGMMLSAKRGLIKDGNVVASKEEQDIFEALDIRYIPPERRECYTLRNR